jgi:histidyl-tRNA synthetase
MNDLLPPESARWRYFEERCKDTLERYGYSEIRTPVLESTALFARGIGDATDIVEKEMYTFPDRKGRSLTLRPEMTASTVRAYVQHSIAKKEPITRWYYLGPMFRYERMQTGRYRQFYQIGVEAFGAPEPALDAEQIVMLYDFYREFEIPGLEVAINSVGSSADRPHYREALVKHFEPHKDKLCEDCRRRLYENPLRLFDCKVPSDQALIKIAPSVLDHLGEASRKHFEDVKLYLNDFGVPFRVEPRLVRGLDYYTATVFEMTSKSAELGSQSAIVGGGRYDELVESLGGAKTPAVGFALGIERNIMSVPETVWASLPRPDVFIACQSESARRVGLGVARDLRRAGLRVDIDVRNVSMKSQFKRADKVSPKTIVTLGDNELAAKTANLRPMNTRDEVAVPLAELESRIRSLLE